MKKYTIDILGIVLCLNKDEIAAICTKNAAKLAVKVGNQNGAVKIGMGGLKDSVKERLVTA